MSAGGGHIADDRRQAGDKSRRKQTRTPLHRCLPKRSKQIFLVL